MTGLQVTDVFVRFGGVHALSGVSLSVVPGRVTGVIGANGAGKSTLFNCAAGTIRPTAGRVVGPDGREVASASSAARAGIGRTFQNLRLAGRLTAYENVCALGRRRRLRAGEAAAVLDRVGFRGALAERVDILPYGEQKKVALARAVTVATEVLLLDEPASGLTPDEVADLSGTIRSLAAAGMAVGVIDHNLAFMTEVSDWLAAMAEGRLIAVGDPREVAGSDEVIRTYVGAAD